MKHKDLFGDDLNQEDKNEFTDLLAQSETSTSPLQRKLTVGEKITAVEILSIGKDESYVSTGTTHDALIPTKELYNDDNELAYKVGDRLDVYVSQLKKGQVRVSRTGKNNTEADSLEDAFDCMLPVEGRVNEVCNGGFRVVIMGKSAFCPISQMDSKHITDAPSYIGKKFEFLITQFEEGGRNIVVSRRRVLDQQKEDSLASFTDEHKPGDILKGMVTRIEKFGAFVEIAPSLEGLVHISEVSWSRLENPSEVLTVGQVVSVKLLKSETVEGRLKISLSIKQATEEPWDTHKNEFNVGDIVVGKVTNLLKFGAFVQIKPGIEGLIPLSEMSYTKRITRSDELIKSGESIKVMIKEIRPEDKKILLSLRDAEGDPWALVMTKYPVGKIIDVVIEKKEQFGYIMRLEPGVTGLLPRSTYKELVEGDWEHKKVGDSTKAQIAEIKFDERRLTLRPPGDESDEAWKTFDKSSMTSSFGGALGDQLKALLNKK